MAVLPTLLVVCSLYLSLWSLQVSARARRIRRHAWALATVARQFTVTVVVLCCGYECSLTKHKENELDTHQIEVILVLTYV